MKEERIKKLKKCRVCTSANLQKVLEFGPTPLANAFLNAKQREAEEYFYPLDVYFCKDCSFVQLGHVVDPILLFKDYVYVSSTSQVFVNHFRIFAEENYKRFQLDKNSLVVDIGSNDGILLKPFLSRGSKVLGIEPASHIAKVANKEGVTTISEFFSINLAKRLVEKHGNAKIVTATNVFAHIDNLEEVIKGLKILLDKEGVFIMEAPYIIDFLKKNYFDLVYHEHLSYWAVKALQDLFERFNMRVFDVQKVAVHGGSIRVFVCLKDGKHMQTNNVRKFLAQEDKIGVYKIETYLNYSKKVQKNKVNLLSLLTKLKIQGKTIAGYGAPAKGNTMLNYFGIGNDLIDYIIDDSPYKQGLFTPGKRIPVVSSQALYDRKPDYLLILAWNFAPSIMEHTQRYKKNGGKYIIPVPSPKIV